LVSHTDKRFLRLKTGNVEDNDDFGKTVLNCSEPEAQKALWRVLNGLNQFVEISWSSIIVCIVFRKKPV
jgi:hypothetical protein